MLVLSRRNLREFNSQNANTPRFSSDFHSKVRCTNGCSSRQCSSFAPTSVASDVAQEEWDGWDPNDVSSANVYSSSLASSSTTSFVAAVGVSHTERSNPSWRSDSSVATGTSRAIGISADASVLGEYMGSTWWSTSRITIRIGRIGKVVLLQSLFTDSGAEASTTTAKDRASSTC